jgi:hypothetical protein
MALPFAFSKSPPFSLKLIFEPRFGRLAWHHKCRSY